MKKKLIIIYDFDGTITVPPLPKYLLIEKFGYENGTGGEKFLTERQKLQDETGQETMVAYINLMMKILKDNNCIPTLSMLYKGQENLEYRKGIDTFVDSLSAIEKDYGIKINNYFVTGGFAEYVKNLDIAKHFKQVYGAEFDVDKHENITGVKFIMTNAMKIQSIKEIIKSNGQDERDCGNVIYVGDGLTDKYAI